MNEFRRHLLDTGGLSWGIDEEHVYTCPCGSWQLHVPGGAVVAPSASDVRELDGYGLVGGISAYLRAAVRATNAAMDDALWEHEAECPVLQHAATQAGIVRPGGTSPYDWTPEEWVRVKYARYSHLREDGA